MPDMHDGHRERLRKRFRDYGLDNFSDINVLELLLCYVIPRRDVNPVAHELLKTFGSLHGVFDAKTEDLAKVSGVGEKAALLLKLIPQISRRYQLSSQEKPRLVLDSGDAGEILLPHFLHEREEVVFMLCLDAAHRLLCCREVSRGVPNAAELSIRRVVELALAQNSANVVLAHNHPSGYAIPSQEDITSTRLIAHALEMVNICLFDHLVVSGNDYVSMRDSMLI